MALSLIASLNASIGLTPDEIVKRLQPVLYFCEITPQQALDYGRTLSALFIYRPNRGGWELYETDWEFWGMNEDYEYFQTSLWRYACMPMENYDDGFLPARPPVNPRG